MAEIIRVGELEKGDTFKHNPHGMEPMILEVVAVESRTFGRLGGTTLTTFEPKTGEYHPLLRRTEGEAVRISSINPETGETIYF